MKKFLSAFLVYIHIGFLGAQFLDPNHWQLIYDDEFDSDQTFNSANPSALWLTGYGWEGAQTHGTGNDEEPQYYTRYNKNFNTTCDKGGTNHEVKDGVLSLKVRKEPNKYYETFTFPNGQIQSSCRRFDYTSGLLFSKQAFRYGYFEIKCKIPNQGRVLWPAFWLYSGSPIAGADPSHGTYREIDIFEFIGGYPNLMGTNIHFTRGLITGDWSDPAANAVTSDQYNVVLGNNVDITNQFHTYAVKWSPNSIVWYFDGMAVRTITNQVPHWDMYLITNLAISPWTSLSNTETALPNTMDIDYIRVYKAKDEEFYFQSGSNDGKIGWWYINPSDKMLALDYNGDGVDELQAISNKGNSGDWSQSLKYSNGSWQTFWSNAGNDRIGNWYINSNDKFVAGDFDGDLKDEIHAFASSSSPLDWSQTLKYQNNTWNTIWSNPGNDKIGNWYMNLTDKFVAGDFDGDFKDEIQCFNTTSAGNDWSQTLKYNNGVWQTTWSNPGNDKIATWYMNPKDKFVAGDFDGDGKDEIQCFSPTSNTTDWSQTLKFVNGIWQTIWSNPGNDKIGYWYLNASDKFTVIDFDGDGKDDILCCAVNGWSQVLTFQDNNWVSIWGNDGSATIHLWKMDYRDIYVAGNFVSDSKGELFAASHDGWHQEIKAVNGVNLRIADEADSDGELGNEQTIAEDNFLAYPNPISKGQLNFGRNVISYELKSISGVAVLHGMNSDHVLIDGLPKGLYLLNIEGRQQKIVIQ